MMDYVAERFAPGPLFAWLCVAFAALIPLTWIFRSRQTRRPFIRFSSVDLVRGLGKTWASRTRVIVPILRCLAIAALIVALARPRMGGSYRAAREGIAIQMLLDVSGSMAEQDFVVNGQTARRLDAVKRVFEDFVLGSGAKNRENDLIGMTSFAKYADTACPLTLDHGSLVDLLREAEIPGWIDRRQIRELEEAGYTALGDAIVLGTDHLRRAGEQAVAGVPGAEAAKSRVMILLTDGKNNPAPRERGQQPSPEPVEAAELAATLGIKIYTIGAVGSQVAQRSRRGFMMGGRASVDEPTLQKIATVTGGRYFRATDTDSLVEIYDEIDQLERRRTGERVFQDNVWAAKIAMMSGLGLLMFELLLVNTRYRRIP